MGVEMPTRRSADPSDRQHRFWNGIAWVETGAGSPARSPAPVPSGRPRLVTPRPPSEPITPVGMAFPHLADLPARGPGRLPSHRALPSTRRRAAAVAVGCLGLLGAATALLASLGALPR